MLVLHMTQVLDIICTLVGWYCYLCKVCNCNNLDMIQLFSLMGVTHNGCLLGMILMTQKVNNNKKVIPLCATGHATEHAMLSLGTRVGQFSCMSEIQARLGLSSLRPVLRTGYR